MASKDLIEARMELGADWLDGRDAARTLGVGVEHLTNNVGSLLTRKSRSQRGRGARKVGYAYSTYDIKRCKEIMRALGCNALRAAQLVHGIRRLGQLGLLDRIERQQVIE